MATNSEIDLVKIFSAVSKTMVQNQTELNNADTYNHDHGDNMVEIFKLVSKVMETNKNASPSEQLALAGKQIQSNLKSGSADLYAKGFLQASEEFKGQQQISTENMLQLLQILMGSGQTTQPTPTQQTTQPSGDALGSLLGTLGSSLGGQTQQAQSSQGLGLNNLISAGLAFLQSQQQGESTVESIVDAIMAGSQMGSSADREQSGKLIANTIMQVISSMNQK